MPQFALTLLMLLSSMAAPGQQPKKTLQQFVKDTLFPATTILYRLDENGNYKMQCTTTAFYTDEDSTMFLTAAHCINSDKRSIYFIADENNENEKTFYRTETPVFGKPADGEDVCILLVMTKHKFPVVPIGDDPKELVDVVNVASPLGMGKQVFKGNVSMLRLNRAGGPNDSNWYGTMLLQIPGTNSGSSGSAIVCSDQQAICGVLVGVLFSPLGNEVVAVPASRVKQFIVRITKK